MLNKPQNFLNIKKSKKRKRHSFRFESTSHLSLNSNKKKRRNRKIIGEAKLKESQSIFTTTTIFYNTLASLLNLCFKRRHALYPCLIPQLCDTAMLYSGKLFLLLQRLPWLFVFNKMHFCLVIVLVVSFSSSVSGKFDEVKFVTKLEELHANVIQCVQKVTEHLSLSALFLDNQRFSFLVFRL